MLVKGFLNSITYRMYFALHYTRQKFKTVSIHIQMYCSEKEPYLNKIKKNFICLKDMFNKSFFKGLITMNNHYEIIFIQQNKKQKVLH